MPEQRVRLSPERARELTDALAPLAIDIRQRRSTITERWLNFHAAYTGTKTRSFFRSEMFSHFVPAARRAVERFTVRCAQMLIPSTDFFEVYPGDLSAVEGQADKGANAVRAVLSYVLRRRVRTYLLVRRLVRSWCMYGRAVTKTGVEISRLPDGNVIAWPTVRVVDPFMFYAYPETVSDPARLQLMMEDFMLPWDHYNQLAEQGMVERLTREKIMAPEWPDHHVRRLQEMALSTPTDSTVTDETLAKTTVTKFVSISELWFKRDGAWVKIWLVWNYEGGVRLARYVPEPPPAPPYRVVFARDLPSEQYGTGIMDDLEPMQVLLNDQVNMSLEGQATNFSPPTVVDPNRVSRHASLVFRPRAKWLADPEGIKFFEPRDITRFAFQGIQFTLGLMDSFSGSNPLAEGQPTRNLPRAGFAVSSLLSLAQGDIKDAAQVIEDGLLSPLLGDLYRLLVQYTSQEVILQIPGSQDWPAQQVAMPDLIGEWDFQWVGSLQAQDMQVKAQRMVSFLGIMGKLGAVVVPDLQARGKRINWEAIMKIIWRQGLGERGLDKIIEDMTPEEIQQAQQERMMAQMAAQQKAMGGAAVKMPGGQSAPVGTPSTAGRTSAYPRTGEDMDRQMGRQMAGEPQGP